MSEGAPLADFPDPVSVVANGIQPSTITAGSANDGKLPKPRKQKTPEQMAQMRAKKAENAARLKREKQEKLEKDIEDRIRREMAAQGFQGSVPTEPLPPAPRSIPEAAHLSAPLPPYPRKKTISKPPANPIRQPPTPSNAGPGFDPRSTRPPIDLRDLHSNQFGEENGRYAQTNGNYYGYEVPEDDEENHYNYPPEPPSYSRKASSAQVPVQDSYYMYPEPAQARIPLQNYGDMTQRNAKFNLDLNKLEYV